MMSIDNLATLPSMIGVSFVMAFGWSFIIKRLIKFQSNDLTTKQWWPNALGPTVSMMHHFGYPKKPTETFPQGVTEEMAREAFAFLNALIFAHLVSVIPMVPLAYHGWANASEAMKICFVLGTLSDVGFQIYDTIDSTIRTFFHKSTGTKPLPFNYWLMVVLMHHSMAMSVVIPMNIFYLHLDTYHQTITSLLIVGGLCHLFGNIKFTLNVKSSPAALYQYKAIAVTQFLISVYTRLYMWFPSMISLLSDVKSDSKVFFVGGCFMSAIFSIFNVILVLDSTKACIKWLPKKFSGTTTSFSEKRPSLRLSLTKKKHGTTELKNMLVTFTADLPISAGKND